MARTCSSARPDENSVGGADAGTGSGTAPYSVALVTTPYNAAPVTSTNVRRAISRSAPDTRLHPERNDLLLFIVISFTVVLSPSGSQQFALGSCFQQVLQLD